MSERLPNDRLYSPDHVWITEDGKVGVTPRLLEALRSVQHIHLPSTLATVRTAEPFGALEGDKGAIDLYAPSTGTVIERNQSLDCAELSADPFESWLIRIDGAGRGGLLSADAYRSRMRAPYVKRR